MTNQTPTSRDMLAALYRHFGDRWAMLTEVTARTGSRQRDRRIDVLLVRPNRRTTTPITPRPTPAPVPVQTNGLFPPLTPRQPAPHQPACGLPIERMAIEIKVARADFRSDVRAPEKQAPWRELAHRHAYAVPAGLVRLEEVPAWSGLIEVTFDGPGVHPLVAFTRRAPRSGTDPGELPLANVMDAFWRTSRLEAESKGYGYEPHADDNPDRLRAEVKRLRHELALATDQAGRHADKCREWQKRWAAHEPPPCGTCGKPLHIARGRDTTGGREWVHRDEGDAAMCELLRTAAAERSATDNGDGRYQYRSIWVAGPEPADPVIDTREDVRA